VDVIFFGTSRFGILSLEAITRSRHTVKAVVSTADKPRGRDLKVQASPIKQWAAEHRIDCLDFSQNSSLQVLPQLKELNADVFVVISFGVILKKEMLALPSRMPLNVHASLLPKYRGATPMQTAILNGDRQTGVTVIKMAERLDAGEILLKKKISLNGEETIDDLEKNLSALSAESILEALEILENGCATLTAQNENEASYTKKITKNDGKIDWQANADQIAAKVRAYLGWPGTFFFFRGQRIVLAKARPGQASHGTVPGAVLATSDKSGILVATGQKTTLRLERLQLEGKRALDAGEFLRGFPLKVGQVLA
jgi:methionyl-tRNA formyltransferase